ncbi:MAG: hypothetical protein CMA36_01165, partial [Euryarchaeota archaeon]|nr:hypothetical protein [Euryarchaeota archaeon]
MGPVPRRWGRQAGGQATAPPLRNEGQDGQGPLRIHRDRRGRGVCREGEGGPERAGRGCRIADREAAVRDGRSLREAQLR